METTKRKRMAYTVFLHDKDGGERGTLEAETIDEILDELNSLDGSDALDRGCSWLGAYDITVEETGEELPITFGKDCRYHLTKPIEQVE